MITKDNITHPTTCFGISRHNVIIPLKVVKIKELGNGCFRYDFEINHPKPTDYMKTHYGADFEKEFVSEDRPLCNEFNKIRLTLDEAKELVTKQLMADRNTAMMTVNSIDKSLEKINSDIAELEVAIKNL